MSAQTWQYMRALEKFGVSHEAWQRMLADWKAAR